MAFSSGCFKAKHGFIASGMMQAKRSPKPLTCDIRVLTALPPADSYSELGLCTATATGGGAISDKTPDAVVELKRCACEHGGDAIVVGKLGSEGYGSIFGYSQQGVSATGVVIAWDAPNGADLLKR